MIKTIQATGFLLCLSIVAFSADLIIGSADTVYRLGQDPSGNPTVRIAPYHAWDTDFMRNKWVADACVSYIKKDENTIISFWPLPNRIQRYEGTLKNPRMVRTTVAEAIPPGGIFPGDLYQWGTGLTPTPMHYSNVATRFIPPSTGTNHKIAIFLKNVYQFPTDPRILIGFTHNEILEANDNENRWYSIGIAFSRDFGVSWTFCGEIIRPGTNIKNNDYNLCGVPYLVVMEGGVEYFYVYFKEYLGGPTSFSVARGSVSEAIQSGFLGRVSTWQKFNGTPAAPSWSSTALSGHGSDVFTQPGIWGNMDIHGDAVKCTFLKNDPYVLFASAFSTSGTFRNAIVMYRSNDGINWGPVTVIATSDPATTRIHYPFLMANQGTAGDGHEMGSGFYLYYPQINIPGVTYCHNYSIVRHRVSANIVPTITNLLLK